MAEPPYKMQRVDSDPDDDDAPPSRVEAPGMTTIPTVHFRVHPIFEEGLRRGPRSPCPTFQELYVLQGIGAILDKPQWWRKWRDRPEVRERWLDEIERAYVEQTFMSIFKWWPLAHDRERLYCRVRAAVVASADERPNALRKIADATVSYKTEWLSRYTHREVRDEGVAEFGGYRKEYDISYFNIDVDDQYVDALNMLEETIDPTAVPLPKLNPFGQLGWYIHQWSRIRCLWEIGVENFTLQDVDVIFGRDGRLIADAERYEADRRPEEDDPNFIRADQRNAREAADVVFALRGSDHLNVDAMRVALGNPDESRDDVLLSLLQYVALIHVELAEVRRYIVTYIRRVMGRCQLCPKDREEGRNPSEITWGPVEETFMSDNLIPSQLKGSLIKQMRVLEDVPEDQRDWHPRADGQVLDLVHPSLYCGIHGVTKYIRWASSSDRMGDTTQDLLSLLIRSKTDGVRLRPNRSQFQWLPSEFEISESGDSCHIRSYINNLHPEDHADLYKTIAAIFTRFIPLFENVLSSLKGPVAKLLMPPDDILYKNCYGELPLRQPIPIHVRTKRPSLRRFSLCGQTLQVVVKIAEIVLTPDKPRYNGGSWHIEGTKAERIIATGIYYFQNENLTDSHLAFRTDVDIPLYAQGDEVVARVLYGQALIKLLGTVTTLENRCLVFPNTLQHQVQPFELVDKNKPGVRKILCFFVIDPSIRIPSTADIAPQQRDWIERARLQELQHFGIATNVPETGQQQIVQPANEQGLTLEEAKAYRLQLMDERSSTASIPSDIYFALCEH